LGNTLLDNKAFKVGHGAQSCTPKPAKTRGVIPSLNVPVVVVDTPGYGDSGGNDAGNFREMIAFLEDEVMFVNVFLIVLNATRCDEQLGSMFKAYHAAFGPSFLGNTMVVVTHWDMSNKARKIRTEDGVTEETYREEWTTTILKLTPGSQKYLLPFVFIDLRPERGDPIQQNAFMDAITLICTAGEAPSFACLRLAASPSIQKHYEYTAVEKGLQRCDNCKRYFTPIKKGVKSNIGAIPVMITQGEISFARLMRVLEVTQQRWKDTAVIDAMTKSWKTFPKLSEARAFGEAASTIGVVVPVGFATYRVFKADTNIERAQAVAGTGAGIAGGYAGLSWGASIGTFFAPGVGTVLGGIFGSLLASTGAQIAIEKYVAGFERHICPFC